MSGLGLLTDYNYDSEASETEDKTETPVEQKTKPNDGPDITEKLKKLSNDSGVSHKSREDSKIGQNSKTGKSVDQHYKEKHSDRNSSGGSRDKRSRDEKVSRDEKLSRDEKVSRDEKGSRDDRGRRDRDDRRKDDRSARYHGQDRSHNYKQREHRGRDSYRRDHRGGRDSRRRDKRSRSEQEEKDREYEEYRRRKYGDSREWGKVSAESLKDVQTDETLPSSFDNTIAKQLAAQREKRKLLWGKKEGEASTQKSVWGAGSLKNDETGEQTAKFLKLMGVRDVTAENVKNYQKSDESVLRSSEAVDSMETEYEKSRYLQHINKGVGLGMIQFTKQPPPT